MSTETTENTAASVPTKRGRKPNQLTLTTASLADLVAALPPNAPVIVGVKWLKSIGITTVNPVEVVPPAKEKVDVISLKMVDPTED